MTMATQMKTTTMTATMAAAASAVALAAKAAQRLVLSDARRRQDPRRALRWDARLLVAWPCLQDYLGLPLGAARVKFYVDRRKFLLAVHGFILSARAMIGR